MAILGIRKRIKQVIKDVLGLSAPPSAPSTYAQPAKSNYETKQEAKTSEQEATNTPPKQSPFAPQSDSSNENSSSQEQSKQEDATQEDATQEVSTQEVSTQEDNQSESSNQEAINSDFTFAQVEEVLDDMIRPALQNDGGDITLVEIKDNSIYVQLRGACGTCPSSTATMQFGVKNLLNEEFPKMVHLYDITSGTPMIVEDPSMA
jgi:Fe-S cluster biogenesis protein NfuA